MLGLLPLAWVAALRAGRLVSARTWPRVVGATVYVLSPVVLGAFAQGLIGPLVAAVLLPGLVVGDTQAMDPVLVEDFRRAGLAHLTAVSGYNVR